MINAGEVTAGDLYKTDYFDNTLVLLDLTGAELLADLEIGVAGAVRKPDGSQGEGGSFPTLSGARFSVDLNNPPGSRVTAIEIKNKDGRYEPLRPEAVYRVVTISYLAGGGNGYVNMKNAGGFRKEVGEIGYLALIEYARHLKTLNEPEENCPGLVQASRLMKSAGGYDDPSGGENPFRPRRFGRPFPVGFLADGRPNPYDGTLAGRGFDLQATV